MVTPGLHWRPPLLWRAALQFARAVVGCIGRLRVSGDVPRTLRSGPLILAVNHISPFDPIVLTAACGVRRISPRIMATGGLFRAPVVGPVMRAFGHIRVDRGTPTVGAALGLAVAAVLDRSVVAGYPEGRIGLDPYMWPERGKTGLARLALASGALVVPVAIWGAHEIVPYTAPRGALRRILRAIVRRPVVGVHFGLPVDLADLANERPGDASKATDRIQEALTVTLAVLRPDEPRYPRYVDPTRPTSLARVRGLRD